MRTKIMALSAFTFLTACVSGTSLFFLDNKTPSTFTPEERAFFDKLPTYDINGYCVTVKNKLASYTAADRKIVAAGMHARGLTKRDVELVMDGSYGTGMTFNGLKCLVGYEPPVNASFYPGIGHQWQAVLGDEYVYLEGDGTVGGMRVTSWN